jgi:hypothetical protein
MSKRRHRGNPRKYSVNAADEAAEISTDHLSNRSLESHVALTC